MTYANKLYSALRLKYTILLLAIISAFLSCQKPPDYSNIPEIAFDTLQYKQSNVLFDTIILTINFQDGDGDLGLSSSETDVPYNPFNVQYNSSGDTIKAGDPGTPSFNYYDYEEIAGDSVYVERNPHFFNFLVEFYEETSPGVFVHKDYRNWCINNNVCIPFHGRFEPISDQSKNEPLEGSISYSMVSSQFPKGNIKFQITICDRSLNMSNTVESTVVTIQ